MNITIATIRDDHTWSPDVAEHLVNENGKYILQPNAFYLYGLKGNLNNLFEKPNSNVLSDAGKLWASEMYVAYAYIDKLQRDHHGRPYQKFPKNDRNLVNFARLVHSSFKSGQKSRFISSLKEATKQEVLRRYNISTPNEDYFRVPQPKSIADVLERLTGPHQQNSFLRGNRVQVYTPIFDCFKTLALDGGSDWLIQAIQSYLDAEGMMVVLAPCNQCRTSRKHSLERWASKKLLDPLRNKVEAAEKVAFGCKMIMNVTVDINSPKMADANLVVIRMRSRFMPASRHTDRNGGGAYYLEFGKKENPAASVVKRHFSAALNAGRASGMSLEAIKKELFDALREYDVTSSQQDSDGSPREEPPEEVVNEANNNDGLEEPPEGRDDDNNEADASGANDDEEPPEVRDDDEAAATAACINVVDGMFRVSLLNYL